MHINNNVEQFLSFFKEKLFNFEIGSVYEYDKNTSILSTLIIKLN